MFRFAGILSKLHIPATVCSCEQNKYADDAIVRTML